MDCESKNYARHLLRRRLLRPEFLPGHDEHRQSGHDHRLWWAWFTEYEQPHHSASDDGLGSDLLEKPKVRSAPVLHPVFLPESCSMVCGHWQAKGRASQHGLRGGPLRVAFNARLRRLQMIRASHKRKQSCGSVCRWSAGATHGTPVRSSNDGLGMDVSLACRVRDSRVNKGAAHGG